MWEAENTLSPGEGQEQSGRRLKIGACDQALAHPMQCADFADHADESRIVGQTVTIAVVDLLGDDRETKHPEAQIEIKAIDLEPCLLTEAGDNLCPGGRAGYVRRHRADIAVELRVCRFGPVAECTPEIQQWIAHCCHLPIEYAHQGT